jgi:beta-glucosidase
MSRSLPFKPSAISSALVVAWVAAACGHSQQVLDAFESAKNGTTTSAGSGNIGSSAGAGNVSNLPQFDCKAVASQQFDPDYMKAYYVSPDVTSNVESTLSLMSSQVVQATQMIGVPVSNDFQDIERSPDVPVPGLGGQGIIRGYNYRDAGRGVNLDAGQKNRPNDNKNYATVFPAASVRAASWDLELEKRVGAASGDETAASKNNMLLAPCMNIIRHPYWGRTQETYSEDMYHIGRMATAYTVGLQEYVTGCAKHFAANNVEKGRSSQNALMNEQTLREIYGRHFEMVVQDGGVGCIMASYNMINGVKSTQNKHLLTDILKAPIDQGGMGFQGLVISDWWAMPGDQQPSDPGATQSNTTDAAKAGLDIEVPWTLHYSTTTLALPELAPFVRESARRVLTQKYRFNSATGEAWSPKAPTSTLTDNGNGGSLAPNAVHEALAEEVELKSAVLVANGPADAPLLPLKSATKIAVVGLDEAFTLALSSVPKACVTDNPRSCTFHFATDPALGDRGSARVNGDPARSVGPFDGIKTAAGASRTVISGNSAAAVGDADTVVVVVGYTPGDEGEEYAIQAGGDRHTLSLPEGQEAFIDSVLSLNKPTVIIIEAGSIVNLPWLKHTNQKQATVWAGYGGLRGGAALGKLIFAAEGANFSGKMPMAWPTQAELDVMPFKETETATHMGYFFGYREYDRRKAAGMAPNMVFPFGHGLSYSTFAYSNVKVPCETAAADSVFNVTVDVQNTSDVDGDEVVMLFVKPPPKPDNVLGDRPVKELKSFARVSVKAHQTVTAQLPVRIRDLRRWSPDKPADTSTTGKWTIDSGAYTILIGKNADDADTMANMGTMMVSGY